MYGTAYKKRGLPNHLTNAVHNFYSASSYKVESTAYHLNAVSWPWYKSEIIPEE
jgi:hypothetical protein